MGFELVEVTNEKNIILSGCLWKRNNINDTCIVYIPGMAGNIFTTKFVKNIYERMENVDFLFAHNKGSFPVYNMPYIKTNGKRGEITSGATYELFKDWNDDTEAWISYADKHYKKIILMGHSLGCNKIVECNRIEKIEKIILLSPQDISEFAKLDIHKGMYEEAKDNCKKGKNEKILSKQFLGFMNISAEAYIQYAENKEINNIPYKGINSNWEKFENINKKTYCIIGEKDIGEKYEAYFKNMKNHLESLKCYIIEGANHNFRDKEEELYYKIKEIIEKG